VLVEGRWCGAADAAPYVEGAERMPWPGGVSAERLAGALAPLVASWHLERLGDDPELWGGPVPDERYALIGEVSRTNVSRAGSRR